MTVTANATVGLVFDLETVPFSPGNMAPEPVCVAGSALPDNVPRLLTWHPDDQHAPVGMLLGAFGRCLKAGHGALGHGVAYDMAVLWQHCPELRGSIVALYDAGLVWDTAILDQMWHIAAGRPPGRISLEACAKRWLGLDLSADKAQDAWRTRYDELQPYSIEEWPAEAVNYPLDDVAHTRALWDRLMVECDGRLPPTYTEQCSGAWALHNAGAWGLRTDGDMVRRVEQVVLAGIAEREPALTEAGIGAVKAHGRFGKLTKPLQARVKAALVEQGIKVRLTKTGQISTEREVVLQAAAADPVLDTFAEWQKLDKIRSTYLTPLWRGTMEPLHVRYNVIVRTGRTSASGYRKQKASDPPPLVVGLNVQNQPRKIEGAPQGVGVRECFVPRPGYVFIDADYSMLELRTLAECMLKLFGKRSRLLDALCAGADVHLVMASTLLGKPYLQTKMLYEMGDPTATLARQLSKPINFGAWGGLGKHSLVSYLRGYGIKRTVDECAALLRLWKKTWPSSVEFFAWRSRALQLRDTNRMIHPLTGFVRGDCTYCGGLNFVFQHLAAHGAKRAAYALWRETRWDQGSPLYGVAQIAGFVHDEFLLEVVDRPQVIHACAVRLQQVMTEQMETVVRNVPCPTEVAAMRRWSKKAKPVYRDDLLIPWEDAA